MRRLSCLVGFCLLSGCATFDGAPDTVGRKYVVFFTKGSASITGSGNGIVSHAASAAKRHGDYSVLVEGYVAANGDRDSEVLLAHARTQAVAAALQADGVDVTRIHEDPRPPSNEDHGVAARRVEIGFVSP
ncbi:MAG: OmpA family protein [Janthinobacterium lividum]